MGLDISFNRQQALDAGLRIEHGYNGDAETLAAVRENLNRTPEDADLKEYLEWLETKSELIAIPGHDGARINDSVDPNVIQVRANHWGAFYQPLTQWLKAHDIEWEEF